MTAVRTGGRSRFAVETEDGSLGDGPFAQDVEIELNRVIHHAGQIADGQVNSRNTPGAIPLGCFERDVQYALSRW